MGFSVKAAWVLACVLLRVLSHGAMGASESLGAPARVLEEFWEQRQIVFDFLET